MSDSKSDSDLNVGLNMYGSPIKTEQPEDNDNVGEEQPGPSTVVLVRPNRRSQFCSCKNTCSKGSGRKKRGCPCRDEGLRCADICKCSTKKASCKNKDGTSGKADPQNTNAGRNAFERHQIAVEEAKQQITVSVFHTHDTIL